jgi:serine/threonine-protein kinase HipA
MRKARVLVNEMEAGLLKEVDAGYLFEYHKDYLANEQALPVSLTLPMSQAQHLSNTLHPFFDGLIPEGWLLEVAVEHWKADQRDRFGLLLAYGSDCIGNVSIHEP